MELFFVLTSLQIGDIQSYISKLYLHVDHEKKRLVFFVDHAPWTKQVSRSKSVELWQLMVTQSRNSPFATRKNQKYGSLNRESDADTHLVGRAASKDLNPDSDEGFTTRISRKQLFQTQMQHLVSLLKQKLSPNKNQVLKYFGDFFQHRLSMQELSHLLHGCITFKIEWDNVRGINYVNELQTDTSLALEVKLMEKREFSDFDGALKFYGLNEDEDFLSSFSMHSLHMGNDGISHPVGNSLFSTACFAKEYNDVDYCPSPQRSSDSCYDDEILALERTSCIWYVTPDAHIPQADVGDFSGGGSCVFIDADQCDGHDKKRHFGVPLGLHVDIETESVIGSITPESSLGSDFSDEDFVSYVYKDTLIHFRFNDPMLPLELKKIITADLRLLKMLESGLPSWALFLQSYPVVTKLYWPWMRPLARTMYVLISIITVIIGFYDLYKNVPVLKATAARLCGPLFEWIEAWEMISRIKYLGTVIFLQNSEKAFRWLLLVIKTTKRLAAIVMQPMMEPLEEFVEIIWPVWNIFFGYIWAIMRLIWLTVFSAFEYATDFVQLMVWPVVVLLTLIWKLVALLLYPIISIVWYLIALPLHLMMVLSDIMSAFLLSIYNYVQNSLALCTQILFAMGPQAEKTTKSSASTWRVLWNDIFSQVFRAVRSIINVLVAFFTACNRHRLSIYNHITAFIFRLMYLFKCAHSRVSNTYYHAVYAPLRGQDFDDEDLYLPADSEMWSTEHENL